MFCYRTYFTKSLGLQCEKNVMNPFRHQFIRTWIQTTHLIFKDTTILFLHIGIFLIRVKSIWRETVTKVSRSEYRTHLLVLYVPNSGTTAFWIRCYDIFFCWSKIDWIRILKFFVNLDLANWYGYNHTTKSVSGSDNKEPKKSTKRY